MKIKLSEITSNIESLNELAKIKLPIKASYQISRLLKRVAPEIDTWNEKRNELLKELGKPQGNMEILIEKDNVQKFSDEMKKVNDIEITLEFEKIKITELGDIQIEPRLLIDWIFE